MAKNFKPRNELEKEIVFLKVKLEQSRVLLWEAMNKFDDRQWSEPALARRIDQFLRETKDV